MAATFKLKLGSLDLSSYTRVNPDDRMDPYSPHFVEPAFAETPFADSQVLISTTVQNREQAWPLYLQSQGVAQTNLVPNPSFEYDTVGGAAASWGIVNGGATWTSTSIAVQSGWANLPGYQSLRVTGTKSNDATAQNLGAAQSIGGGGAGLCPAVVGGVYTIQALLNVQSAASNGYRIVIAWIQADGSTQISTASPVLSAPGATGLIPLSFTTAAAPALTAFLRVQVLAQSASALQVVDFYVDQVMVTNTPAAVAYGDGDSKGWLWSATPGNSTSNSLVGKDGLHQLIAQINNTVAQRPLMLEWRDDSASASTFFDVVFARFEPDFNFRRSQAGYGAGVLHTWVAGYGHTGTTRVTATAAGTGVFLSVPVASLAGDAPALIDSTVNAGAVLPSLGRIVALAPITNPSYTPRIPAASLTDLQTNATVVGASGADGSQYLALPISPTGGASGVACKVPLPNPTIAGGDNRILALVQSGIDAGVGLYALDPFGNAMGATAVASTSQGYSIVDLGVCRLPTVGFPTQPKIAVYAGALWASGAAGPGILASPAALRINEIFCLPDKNLTLIYERGGASVLSKDSFSGAVALAGQNDSVGNPWSKTYNNVGLGSGVLTEQAGVLNLLGPQGATLVASAIDSAHLAGILADSMVINAKALLTGGEVRLVKERASGIYVQARVNRDTGYMDLGAATSTTLNLLASVALASDNAVKLRFSLQTQGGQAIVNLSRDDGGALLVAGASSAFASLGPSSAAVAGAGVPGVGINQGATAVSSDPTKQSAGAAAVSAWEVDTLASSNLLTFDNYRIDGVNADSYRTSSAGVFSGAKLVSQQRGAFPKMAPSTTSVAVICAPVDQGAANDLISAAISVRERYNYSR